MRLVRRWVDTQAVGVVAVLHDVNLALRYADDVLVLGASAPRFGATRDVLDARLIHAVWGVACQPVQSGDGVPQYLFA